MWICVHVLTIFQQFQAFKWLFLLVSCPWNSSWFLYLWYPNRWLVCLLPQVFAIDRLYIVGVSSFHHVFVVIFCSILHRILLVVIKHRHIMFTRNLCKIPPVSTLMLSQVHPVTTVELIHLVQAETAAYC